MNRLQRQGVLRASAVGGLTFLCAAEAVTGHFGCAVFFGFVAVGCAVCFWLGGGMFFIKAWIWVLRTRLACFLAGHDLVSSGVDRRRACCLRCGRWSDAKRGEA